MALRTIVVSIRITKKKAKKDTSYRNNGGYGNSEDDNLIALIKLLQVGIGVYPT